MRELYFHAEEQTAVLRLECDNIESACRVLETLQLVQAGLIQSIFGRWSRIRALRACLNKKSGAIGSPLYISG